MARAFLGFGRFDFLTTLGTYNGQYYTDGPKNRKNIRARFGVANDQYEHLGRTVRTVVVVFIRKLVRDVYFHRCKVLSTKTRVLQYRILLSKRLFRIRSRVATGSYNNIGVHRRRAFAHSRCPTKFLLVHSQPPRLSRALSIRRSLGLFL